jgi:hypothetical protein
MVSYYNEINYLNCVIIIAFNISLITNLGDLAWEDGSAIDFTNWEDNQTIVNEQFPTNDDSGEKCVSVKNYDLKWRTTRCTGYTQRNYFVCQTKKVSRTSSASLAGLSGGAKAGIVIGVLIGVTIIVGVGIFVAKRFNLSAATAHNFDNSLYSSRRGQSLGPKGSAFNVSNDLTKTENDSPFEKHTSVP